jgi:hypothetical protein
VTVWRPAATPPACWSGWPEGEVRPYLLVLLASLTALPRTGSWTGHATANPPALQPLRDLSVLVTAMTMVNLGSEGLAIYRLNLSSYRLLFESMALYFLVTLIFLFIFLFWSWSVDRPPRDRTPADPLFMLQSQLNENRSVATWNPGFLARAVNILGCTSAAPSRPRSLRWGTPRRISCC